MPIGKMKVLLLTVIISLANCSLKQYQLEFDWMLNKISTNVQYGYATWNDGTMITLKETVAPNTQHHEKVRISFLEGINQLSFFFIGAQGEIAIDNVVITQPPKTINLLFNGDFELPLLQGHSPTFFNAKIPGWQADTIILAGNKSVGSDSSQALILNSKNFQITQKITFGKIINYSFVSNVRDEIQQRAGDLIKQKMAAFTQGQPQPWAQTNINYTSLGNSNGTVQGVKSMMQNIQTGSSPSISTHIQSELMNQINSIKDQTLKPPSLLMSAANTLLPEVNLTLPGLVSIPTP